MARQKHGFDFEKVVLSSSSDFKATKTGAKFDGYYRNIPVSIKTRSEKNDICLGDYYRQSNILEDFIIIVGTYTTSECKNPIKIWIKVESFLIPSSLWRNLLKYANSSTMFIEMKLITNNKIDDKNWKDFTLRHKKAFSLENRSDTSNSAIRVDLAMKRDHKTQKRIQCRINSRNYRAFKREFTSVLSQEASDAILNTMNNKYNNIDITDITEEEIYAFFGIPFDAR